MKDKCSEPPQQIIVCREAMNGKIFIACCNRDGGNSCKLNHRCRLTGEGIKPPNGAVVKSYGAERFGKGNPRGYQVWIKELNESKPLMRCREVGHNLSKATEYVTERISLTVTCLLVKRQASFRRQELYPGFITELGNLHDDVRLP